MNGGKVDLKALFIEIGFLNKFLLPDIFHIVKVHFFLAFKELRIIISLKNKLTIFIIIIKCVFFIGRFI
jgi:hypothetical protein